MTGRTNCLIGGDKSELRLVLLKRLSWRTFMYGGHTYYHDETFTDLIPGELYEVAYSAGTVNYFTDSYLYPFGEEGTAQNESPRLSSTADSWCNIFRATSSTTTMRFQYFRSVGDGNILFDCSLLHVTKKE